MIILSIMALAACICAFGPGMNEQDWLTWSNKCLSEAYNPTVDAKLKKVEIEVTADHFVRLRKTYPHEKQEYFSFNLQRFADLNYLHSSGPADTLQMKTVADDIIVQTYNDPKGDIDSMATVLTIPVKNMSPERLDSLKAALAYLKSNNQ